MLIQLRQVYGRLGLRLVLVSIKGISETVLRIAIMPVLRTTVLYIT